MDVVPLFQSNRLHRTLKHYHMSNGEFCIQLHRRKKNARISKSTNIIMAMANCPQYQSCPHTHTYTYNRVHEVDFNRQKPTLEMKKKTAINECMPLILLCSVRWRAYVIVGCFVLCRVFFFNFIAHLPLLDRFFFNRKWSAILWTLHNYNRHYFYKLIFIDFYGLSIVNWPKHFSLIVQLTKLGTG